jgi:hypothetical protein
MQWQKQELEELYQEEVQVRCEDRLSSWVECALYRFLFLMEAWTLEE